MEEVVIKQLINKALEARMMSYSPYSEYKVGAALLDMNAQIFTGCNIENASYPATVCAERTAIFKAVSSGSREFAGIAIVGGSGDKPVDFAYPCGVCRQVMSEFCQPDFEIIVAISSENYKVYKLKELLPMSFGKNELGKNDKKQGEM